MATAKAMMNLAATHNTTQTTIAIAHFFIVYLSSFSLSPFTLASMVPSLLKKAGHLVWNFAKNIDINWDVKSSGAIKIALDSKKKKDWLSLETVEKDITLTDDDSWYSVGPDDLPPSPPDDPTTPEPTTVTPEPEPMDTTGHPFVEIKDPDLPWGEYAPTEPASNKKRKKRRATFEIEQEDDGANEFKFAANEFKFAIGQKVEEDYV